MKIKTNRSIDLNSRFNIFRIILGYSVGLIISVYNGKTFLSNKMPTDIDIAILHIFRIPLLVVFIFLSLYFLIKLIGSILDILYSDVSVVRGKITSVDYLGNGGYSSTIILKIDKQKFKYSYSKTSVNSYSQIKKIKRACILTFYKRTRIPISIKYYS